MITLVGEKMACRVGASLLGATGLSNQLVCSSLEGKRPGSSLLMNE